jgi:acyl transferase domain-containing protein
VRGVYEELAADGYGYGPAFRGLRAAWKRGDDIYAEVALPEELTAEAAAFGLHPALLDTALHATAFRDRTGADTGPALPFAYRGVSLHASGASALRVRITPSGKDGVGIRLADPSGAPVAVIESLVSRPVPTGGPDAVGAGGRTPLEHMFLVGWEESRIDPATPVETVSVRTAEDVTRVTGPSAVLLYEPEGTDVHHVTHRTLEVLQAWLGAPALERWPRRGASWAQRSRSTPAASCSSTRTPRRPPPTRSPPCWPPCSTATNHSSPCVTGSATSGVSPGPAPTRY